MNNDTFEWQEAYGDILETIASTDIVQTEWPLLRSMIKYKLDKNITAYLVDGPRWQPRLPMMIATPQQLQNGGLKLPPFPPREYPAGTPKVDLSEKEAKEMQASIHAQLDEFDGTPFTVQRLCELCVKPRQHYKYAGKYLRAVEKSLLVTSTWDSFPPLSESDSTYSPVGHITISTSTVSTPNTPMFSPIPFLHEDARRSSSPPPSPLVLPATIASGLSAAGKSTDIKPLGLVDELDDPSPGHLSDHIEPISSTTTIQSRALTLEERFVKASKEGAIASEGEPSADVSMAQDEDEGKENKAV